LNPKVIADLRLFQHGLKIVDAARRISCPPGRAIPPAAEARPERNVAKFSRTDADHYRGFKQLDASADVLRQLVLQAPPNLTRGLTLRAMGEVLKAGRLGNRLRRLSTGNLRALYDLFTKSAADYLDGWFEGDLVKALHGFDAVVGNYASPYSPGTAYVLLHHAFGEVNGKKRVWGHAIGGMGAITQAMAAAAAEHGVEIETGAPVREVVIEKGRACGVALADGRVVRGTAIAANVNPRLLYTAMVAATRSVGFSAPHAGMALRLRDVRINVALAQRKFCGASGSRASGCHTAGIILAPSLATWIAYCDARISGWAEPIIELLIPSTLDDTLAPHGCAYRDLFTSTWRRICRMDAPGTIIARALPI
jgi:phytoene dehydrogenase-like protein